MKSVEWILLLTLLTGCSPSASKTQKSDAPARAEKTQATSEIISILAWNVESGGNDPEVIAGQLSELTGYDIYCLSEVRSGSFGRYADAFGTQFKSVNGETGRGDRLQVMFNSERFELLQQKELHYHGDFELNNGTHRSPLFVRLRERVSGTEFIVMTNHFARRNADLRTQQASGLREWARDQNVAVINIGDFNLDYDFRSGEGNSAFPEMLRDNIWSWVQPVQLIDTNWADSDGDGSDNYPDSMLDFAFVAGPAKGWNPVCRVIVRDGDFPDDESTSDHRPIELVLELPR